jgi:Arm DNA-binding domain
MQGKVTKTAVDRTASEARTLGCTIRVYDEALKGFGFTAGKTGKVTYFVEYKLGGRGASSRRMTLGPHGPLTAEEARNLAKQKLGEVAKGIDVATLAVACEPPPFWQGFSLVRASGSYRPSWRWSGAEAINIVNLTTRKSQSS